MAITLSIILLTASDYPFAIVRPVFQIAKFKRKPIIRYNTPSRQEKYAQRNTTEQRKKIQLAQIRAPHNLLTLTKFAIVFRLHNKLQVLK